MASEANRRALLAEYARISGSSITAERTFLHFDQAELVEARRSLRRTRSCPARLALPPPCAPPTGVLSEAEGRHGASKTATTAEPAAAAAEDITSSTTCSILETLEKMHLMTEHEMPLQQENAELALGPKTCRRTSFAVAKMHGHLMGQKDSMESEHLIMCDAWEAWGWKPARDADIAEEQASSQFHPAPFPACPTQDARIGLLPSVGSALHGTGRCKPCFYFLNGICEMGESCHYCHLPHQCAGWKRARPPKHVRNKLKEAGLPAVCVGRHKQPGSGRWLRNKV